MICNDPRMSIARVKCCVRAIMPLIGMIIGAVSLAAGLCPPANAQISMQRPGITGVPQGKKQAVPGRGAPAKPSATLTADEQKRFTTIVKHMKSKDRKKLAAALQKMTPQQRQQLVANVKKQLAKTAPAAKSAKRGW